MLAASGRFRLAVLALVLVALLDLVVAAALWAFFEPVQARVSMVAAWLRVAYVPIFLVALAQLVQALRLLESPSYLAAVGLARRDARCG